MFQALNKRLSRPPVLRASLQEQAREGDNESRQILELFDSLDRLAFTGELRSCLSEKGLDLESVLSKGDYTPLFRILLAPEGMDFSRKPKGLIPFHKDPEGPRSPFGEQLEEAAATLADSRGLCKVHFTVPPEYRGEFERLAAESKARFGKKGLTLEITFSIQKPATDTLSVEPGNEPFRDAEGKLVLRPGGHGALIENLNDLKWDLVFIKNIDNVAGERLFPLNVRWKKILGGILVLAEEQERLKGGGSEKPVRVCGVVRNTGEPGGGPFWVLGKDGNQSLQIVESSQLDPASREQNEIFQNSTHFNPVDLVCSVRDRRGKPFDLGNYVDREAVFFSRKSHRGRDLKALELPGLWNGAMAHWTTVFVEVPLETFNPVKTLFDLLKPAHQ
jgi:hypothetical protein